MLYEALRDAIMCQFSGVFSVQCPESVQTLVKQNRDDYEDYNNPTETPTEKSLVRLHVKVIKTTQTYRRTQVQWANLVDKAFDLEDIAENEVSTQRTFHRTYGSYKGMFTFCYSASLGRYHQEGACPLELCVSWGAPKCSLV